MATSQAQRAEKKRDESFGPRVRRLRHDAGLTLQELSLKTGLAFSTISKVEKSQISPTYENILRLADGLGVDVATLFTGTSVPVTTGRRSVTRAGRGVKHETPQYEYEMLCSDISQKQFVPLLTRLRAHDVAQFPRLLSHKGEEFVYVLSGTVSLYTDQYRPLVLEAGDSCYFDSTMGHACVSAGKEDAVILWVCSRVVPPLED
ncbi:MAG TPA: XRE family transcriptional regulator [Xanthobacteraceae bacterium]|nr:XRE family transcriptional regulator [Xanthobacteraceae bacterium]